MIFQPPFDEIDQIDTFRNVDLLWLVAGPNWIRIAVFGAAMPMLMLYAATLPPMSWQMHWSGSADLDA